MKGASSAVSRISPLYRALIDFGTPSIGPPIYATAWTLSFTQSAARSTDAPATATKRAHKQRGRKAVAKKVERRVRLTAAVAPLRALHALHEVVHHERAHRVARHHALAVVVQATCDFDQ